MEKTVLITGSSRGIGAAAAELFCEKGYQVAIHYMRQKQKAENLCKKLLQKGGKANIFAADISVPEEAEKLICEVTNQFSQIDVLVNNAGIAWQGLLQQMTNDEYRKLMDVNFGGAFYCTKAVLPQMIRRKQGSIVNVSSVLGISGGSCEVIYSASKAALIGFTSALAKEVGPSGIRVNCVAPGVIDTDMNACHDEQTMKELAQSTALERIGAPQQVAQAIYYLASEQAEFVTGQTLRVDGGLII